MNVMQKIRDFTISYSRWLAAGRPLRSPEWVAELFDVCRGCDSFDPEGAGPFGGKGVCRECGCHVGANDSRVNKLVIPTTYCPLDKWPAAVDRPKSKTKVRMLAQQQEWKENRGS